MTSLLKYAGGKWRIAPWILERLPPHKVYLEPFFGSGAVFFNKTPSYIETVNDISGDIVNLFRVCREYPEQLARLISLTPWSREESAACYAPSADPVEQARRTVVRYHQSFGTSNSSKNSWKNGQTVSSPRCAFTWNNLPEAVATCCARLKNAQIENVNALELIRRYNDPETLIYCDPPYLLNLRKKNLYKTEMTDAQHIELLKALKESRSMVVLSAYDSDLYNEVLKDWHTDSIATTAQMGLNRTEKLYMNFAPQISMFDC